MSLKNNDPKQYDDDDGRTIADMSDIPGHRDYWKQSLGFGLGMNRKRQSDETPAERPVRPARPWEDHSLSREERRMYMLGALAAALSIGLVYALGLGLIIGLMIFFWT